MSLSNKNLKSFKITDLENIYNIPQIANEYTQQPYNIGDYVNYQGVIYRCTTQISVAESWNSSHWTSVMLADDLRDNYNDLKSALNNTIEEFGYAKNRFSVTSGNSHSSTNDQLYISIPTGAYYKVSSVISGASFTTLLYEIEADNTASAKSTRIPANGCNLYKAEHNINRLGFYIESQSSDYSVEYTVEVIGKVFDTDEKNVLKVEGLEKISLCPDITWTHGIVSANGSISSGNNGATSGIIKNVSAVMLSGGCRAVFLAYKGSTYVGKYNSSGGFDKVSGNWGYITGFVDISSLMQILFKSPYYQQTLQRLQVQQWKNMGIDMQRFIRHIM